MISEANLAFWIKNQYNVLFRGKHGVGKTATILQAFVNHGLKFQYFSASTMDPWVDFIGVPKEKIDEKGNSYLDLVRPKHFQDDDVHAIFLDEFNRSSKKVRNAVMELIQFKSINGKKFNNLKIIWAAINPEDDEDGKYDVEALDPAQLDRFHVCVDIPYAPHVPYFRDKYGATTADVAVTWWKELDKAQKNLVSPRRLDYALDMHSKGGDIKFVLPNSVNTNKLIVELSTGSISKKLKTLFETSNEAEAKTFLAIENNFAVSVSYIIDKKYQAFFLPLLSEEKLVGLMAKYNSVADSVFGRYDKFESIIKTVAASKSSGLSKRAQQIIAKKQPAVVIPATGTFTINKTASFYHSSNNDVLAFKNAKTYQTFSFRNTYDRKKVYEFYNANLPQHLQIDIAKEAVTDLARIAESTQVYTGKEQMPQLIGLLNHAIKYFFDTKNQLPIDQRMIKRLTKKYQGFIV